MPLRLVGLATSAVYGAVDMAAEYADQQLKATHPSIANPFQNVTDLSRLLAFGAGAAGGYFMGGTTGAVLGDLAIASLPLLEKSVVNAVMKATGQTTRFMVAPTVPQAYFVPKSEPAGTLAFRTTLAP
jgi:hypothetical protein